MVRVTYEQYIFFMLQILMQGNLKTFLNNPKIENIIIQKFIKALKVDIEENRNQA